MLLWCRKTRDQLTFLLWKRQNFKFAWADGTACIVEQLWGGDAHRSVSFDIEKLELHPMEHINKICMKEDDSCVGPSSTLYAPNVFISSLTKARSRNLWLYLRYEFRPVGSVSLSKLYRRVGVWRPFSAVDRWVWRLIEILSEIEAWSKRPCLKNVSVSSGKLWRTYLYWTKHPSLSRLINREAWLNLKALKWNTTLAQSKLFCRWWCFIFAHATQTVD